MRNLVVTKLVECLGSSADFNVTTFNRAVNYALIRTVFSTCCGNNLFLNSICRSVTESLALNYATVFTSLGSSAGCIYPNVICAKIFAASVTVVIVANLVNMTESGENLCICFITSLTCVSLNACSSASRSGGNYAIVPFVAGSLNNFLLNDNSVTFGAVLSFCLTVSCTCSLNSLVNNLGMIKSSAYVSNSNSILAAYVTNRSLCTVLCTSCIIIRCVSSMCMFESLYFIRCVRMLANRTSVCCITCSLTSRIGYYGCINVTKSITLCCATKYASHRSFASSRSVYTLMSVNTSVKYRLRIPPFASECINVIISKNDIVGLIPNV